MEPQTDEGDEKRAPVVEDARLRRLLGWELVVVLAVFPLPATLTAVYLLAAHLSNGYASLGSITLAHDPVGTFLFAAMQQLVELAAAGLVVYLLTRSGEGVKAIGLGRGHVRRDLALLLPVWFLVQLIPQSVGSGILVELHVAPFHVTSSPVPGELLLGVIVALVAGVVEEIVVLGYLVRRLEQRGLSSGAVVLVAVAVRVSYHLYYGPGVLPILFWATASVLMYRRVRRLWPFIVCHVAWDTHVALLGPSTAAANTFLVLIIVSSVVLYFAFRNWRPLVDVPDAAAYPSGVTPLRPPSAEGPPRSGIVPPFAAPPPGPPAPPAAPAPGTTQPPAAHAPSPAATATRPGPPAPGWWMASDGRWYPPHLRPEARPTNVIPVSLPEIG